MRPVGFHITREKREKKIPNMINLASTGLSRSTRLANKPKQEYGLFSKLSFSLIGNRENHHTQEIDRHFYGTLVFFGPMVFAENQDQNEFYNFKDMLLQPNKSYFIIAMIKEVAEH